MHGKPPKPALLLLAQTLHLHDVLYNTFLQDCSHDVHFHNLANLPTCTLKCLYDPTHDDYALEFRLPYCTQPAREAEVNKGSVDVFGYRCMFGMFITTCIICNSLYVLARLSDVKLV